MATSTVTSRGQLVIPIELRKRYFIKPGTKVQFEPVEGGILLKPITPEKIAELCGCFAGLGIGDIEKGSLDRDIS
jgi:AbrB family looped-hinge helix DNA binding protein